MELEEIKENIMKTREKERILCFKLCKCLKMSVRRVEKGVGKVV